MSTPRVQNVPSKPASDPQELESKSKLLHRRPGLPTSVNGSSRSTKSSKDSSDSGSAPRSTNPAHLETSESNETEGSSINAEKWFFRSNEESKAQVSFDDDPPFYLEGQSPPADQLSACAVPSNSPPHMEDTAFYSLPLRSAVSEIESFDNDSEDFRSVIDDLTIENKKLKRKLRRYERMHTEHLGDDKLFEVKIHRLPPDKKRALEEALRTFAEALDVDPEALSMPKPSGQANLAAKIPSSSRNPSSPSTSGSRPVDSAYASMSMSGAATAVASGQSAVDDQKANRNNQPSRPSKVQSYLREIPAGLLPRDSPLMSEKSKKKLVVRRLEELFAGKASDEAEHSHQIQQQEVSQSAARADRTAKIAKGQRVTSEGSREAQIFHPDDPTIDAEGYFPQPTNVTDEKGQAELSNPPRLDENRSAGQDSPDQRPTRPLDLDPYRAQYPADNIDYIRHLGLSSPKLSPVSSSASDEGWVYLNLLTNMAQLHTINVTPEFVRKAVAEFSSKFELSHDGRKIRWKGGHTATRLSSDSGSSGGGPAIKPRNRTEADGLDQPSAKRLKTSQSLPTNSMGTSSDQAVRFLEEPPLLRQQSSSALPTSNKSSSFHYEPLLFNTGFVDDDQDSDAAESVSPFSGYADRTSSRSANQQSLNMRKRLGPNARLNGDGSLIFYRKSQFCTDLTGDSSAIHFASTTDTPIPAIGSNYNDMTNFYDNSGKRTVWEDVSSTAMDIDQDGSSQHQLSESFVQTNFVSSLPAPQIRSLDATGLGGVQPADNFALQVTTRYPSQPQHDSSKSRPSRHLRSQVPAILDSVPRTSTKDFNSASYHALESEAVEMVFTPLSPAPLPDSSYAFFQSSDSDCDSDSGTQSQRRPAASAITTSTSPRVAVTSTDSMGPPARLPSKLRHVLSSAGTATDSSSAVRTTADSMDTDSEIDMLAAARAIDPELIAEREAEFDRGVGKRFVEELPAGSSAATAGGGSGWDSGGEKSDEEVEALMKRRDDDVGVNAWGQRLGRYMAVDD